jgi:nucleoside-diphosphate-sugar epimerase
MILVTGGTGYLGSLLVPELLALGYDVRVVDTLWFGNHLDPHPRLQVIRGDIRYCDDAWLDGVDGVIHLAGISNDPTADFAPLLNAEANVLGTRSLAGRLSAIARREARPIRFVMASSCSIYYTATPEAAFELHGKTEATLVAPTANYSKTKRLAEIDLLRLADLNPYFSPVILRKGALFGLAPRMRFDLVINAFTLYAWKRRLLTVYGRGEAWRPLLHVRDAVDAYLYALASPEEQVRGQVFNILHKNCRILELAFWVSEVLEEHRQVSIPVRRDRSVGSGDRSYYVLGEKVRRQMGFQAERGATQAILEIWDALEAGQFGCDPQDEPRYFNLRWFKQRNQAGDLAILPGHQVSLPSVVVVHEIG